MNTEDNKVVEEQVKEDVNLEESTIEKNNDEPKKVKVNKKIEKLQEENDALKQEIADLKDMMLRARAELENFKRRTNEEKIRERKYASQGLVGDLVNSVEYLAKACNMETEDTTLKNFLYGFNMISNQIFDILRQDGLKEIEGSEGQNPSDPSTPSVTPKPGTDDDKGQSAKTGDNSPVLALVSISTLALAGMWLARRKED